jgi:hypothetical protein
MHIHDVKKTVAAALNTSYQSTGYTTPDTSHLIWRVQGKVVSEGLHQFNAKRTNNSCRKLVVDILKTGEAELKSLTLATFKKKTTAMIAGHGFVDDEEDECPTMAYLSTLPDEYS